MSLPEDIAARIAHDAHTPDGGDLTESPAHSRIDAHVTGGGDPIGQNILRAIPKVDISGQPVGLTKVEPKSGVRLSGRGRAHGRVAPHASNGASQTIDQPLHGEKPDTATADLGARLIRRDGQTTLASAQPSDLTKVLAEPTALVSAGASQKNGETQNHAGSAQIIDPANSRLVTRDGPPDQPDSHTRPDDQRTRSVGLLIELWRQRQDLRRAEGRLLLQCKAICRRAVGGDLDDAAVLWKAVLGGDADPSLLLILTPYTDARSSLAGHAHAIELQLCRMVRAFPLWTGWAKDVRGMAELSFAGLIGEANRMPGDYRSVSALWKRFGLAVIDGGRQRLITGKEESALHGYSPQRRAYAYTLSTNLMRSQREEDEYRALYDRRKVYELAREIPKAHAHNRALRVMVKELLKDAWLADRRLAREAA